MPLADDYLLRAAHVGAPIWHSGAGKKGQLRVVRGQNMELRRETGLSPPRNSYTSDVTGAWSMIRKSGYRFFEKIMLK